MPHAPIKTRLAAHAPTILALQAVIAAGLVHVNTVAKSYFFECLNPGRAFGFITLLITPTFFLRVQPISPRARENDIMLKDTPFSCCHA
jgi:hypothetical protein